MPKEANSQEARIDQFFSGPSARADRWGALLDVGQAWLAGTATRARFEAALAEMLPTESYHAYPGAHLLAALIPPIRKPMAMVRKSASSG